MKSTVAAAKPQEDFIHFSDAAADGKVEMFREPESILEDRQSGSCAGVLRPGIKVPKEEEPNRLTPNELAIYQKMMKENISPREIEKVIGKELKPKNVGYFSVYGTECKSDPQSADRIRELYANEKGEIKRLRIIFTDNNWWKIIPHKLMAFKKRGLYCSSEPINGQLIATRDTSLDGPEDNGSTPNRPFRRTLKKFPCVPDECPVYQNGYCRLSGLMNFLIVGVPGTDIWRLPTSSWYSVRGVMEKIVRFNKALSKAGGSLIGIPFWLFKYELEVAGWDAKKKTKIRLKQWLFGIDCPELPLSDLMVKHAGFDISGSFQLPMAPNRPAAGDPGISVPAVSSEPKPVDGADKKDIPTDRKIEPPTTVTPEVNEERPASSEGEDKAKSIPLFPASHTEGEIEHFRTKIQNEVEPRGPVPMDFINLQTGRLHKTRMSDLTLDELRNLERSIEEYKISPWERCSSCRGLLSPDVKGYSLKHFQKALCRECQKKEKGASNLPPQLSVVRKPTGQILDAGF
ncbi:MAG: hypothetical protein HY282_07425 [Nitrospirae bacterium]|nr:hypothetical protein [Candidatus Manganitrophaceae bacterium]